MKIPLVREFLWFNLFTGGLIIGWLGIIGSIFSMLATLSVVVSKTHNLKVELVMLDIVIHITSCVISALLIVGTKKRNHRLLLPWLCIVAFVLSLAALMLASLLILGFVVYAFTDSAPSIPLSFLSILHLIYAFGICAVMEVYMWTTVFSLHNYIRSNTSYSEASNISINTKYDPKSNSVQFV